MVIVLAGFGNMGRALATGWLEARSLKGTITVIDPDAGARGAAKSLGLNAVASAAEIRDPIDIAVLAVKPAEIDAVLNNLPKAKFYVSIAAGKTIAELEAIVGASEAIVRAMPNTPAAIGLGVTGLCANSRAGPNERELAHSMLSAVGAVEWLDDEAQMDALTAVSGSGPAYVFLFIECLTAAGIDAGLEPDLAERLAIATVRGAAAYAAETEVSPGALRRQVTSPKGTTEAALEVLRDGDALGKLVREAVLAAARRSRELGTRVSR